MAYNSVPAVTPITEEWTPDYIGPANELVARHGGKYSARTASCKHFQGEGEHAVLKFIIEWPLREAAEALMSDPGYVPHLKARTAGSNSTTS